MAIECEHGQLKRSCLLCEYEEHIAKLEAKNKKLRELISISYVLIKTFNKRYKDRKMLRTERAENILKEGLKEE